MCVGGQFPIHFTSHLRLFYLLPPPTPACAVDAPRVAGIYVKLLLIGSPAGPSSVSVAVRGENDLVRLIRIQLATGSGC